jgi:hypothetical protein
VRVICPYTPGGLRPATRLALEALGRPVEMVDVSASDDAYAALVARLWAAGADFLLVEHDMIPTAAAVAEMEGCRRWWCANPYPVNHQRGETIEGLGFTRFRAQLLAAEPDVPAGADRWAGAWPARHWAAYDARLARVLAGRGYDRHRHPHLVDHLHLV